MGLDNSEIRRANSGSYKADRRWSDAFIPEIKRLVAPFLLQETPWENDTKEATDLLVFKVRDMRIAARIREAERYSQRYSNQFTIRSKRDNGARTELEKIQRGWGDWFFYGFGNQSGSISPWYLIDLNAFRYHISKEGWMRKGIKMESKNNGDGTHFLCFWIDSFPLEPPILVGSSNRDAEN